MPDLDDARARVAEKRAALKEARQANYAKTKEKDADATLAALEREEKALDADLNYEKEAAKLLEGTGQEKEEDEFDPQTESLTPPEPPSVSPTGPEHVEGDGDEKDGE